MVTDSIIIHNYATVFFFKLACLLCMVKHVSTACLKRQKSIGLWDVACSASPQQLPDGRILIIDLVRSAHVKAVVLVCG
jgi:hypothetical protein